jgi:hypothetical protein
VARLLSLVTVLALVSGHAAHAESAVDLALWAARLPLTFAVTGTKTEPTYQEAIDIRRDGDVFTVIGGAPRWAKRATESLRVTPDGTILEPCHGDFYCKVENNPTGFLATALLVSAGRRHCLHGQVAPVRFGARALLCVPAETLGIVQPIFDPCFDRATGAVLAQRHRLSGRFDGPSLDASSVRVEVKN